MTPADHARQAARVARLSGALYRVLLLAYPRAFRRTHGREAVAVFAAACAESWRHAGLRGVIPRLARAPLDVIGHGVQERLSRWRPNGAPSLLHGRGPVTAGLGRDARQCVRRLARQPGLTVTALLSLSMGIGSTIAIFGLWNAILFAPLPGIAAPEGLVMLTNPATTGSMRGRQSGVRSWLSHAEFVQLRDETTAFSGLMASQARLTTWPVRHPGGGLEPITGRLVSSEYFDVLGVLPAAGRLFTLSDEAGAPAIAVMSHRYWLRRLGADPHAIGGVIAMRDTPVRIVGIAPEGFIGETAGQEPDVWLPIRLQPRVLPGSGLIDDLPPDKVMWLHVFGRLAPGVDLARANAQANLVFRAGLQSFYGRQRESEWADQALIVRPAGRGASASRGALGSTLSIALAAVALLLLITCANLASLLLARGTSRRAETAIRLSLGASRAALIRYAMLEALVLATFGGALGLLLAPPLHNALVVLLRQGEPEFTVAFSLTGAVAVSGLLAVMVSALTCGGMPAWLAARDAGGTGLTGGRRGATGSPAELRARRWLVVGQIAMSLPLLVVAGLFVRTASNLFDVDLGFSGERLLLAQVDVSRLVRDPDRRDRALRDLLDGVRRIPGVQRASFSQIGLLSGGFSTASIEVAGGKRPPATVSDTALDRVGAGYFTTLGIPVRLGHDVTDADGARSAPVCLINEAFGLEYFGKTDVVGATVTTIDDGRRVTYRVIGVSADARTHELREPVDPRMFVPAEQRPSSGPTRTFLIRAAPGATGVAERVRTLAGQVDGDVSAADVKLQTFEDRLDVLVAEERVSAHLALAVGAVALGLAAFGLYGVLSYGLACRRREMAVRLALGAPSIAIVRMVLVETSGVVAVGLAAGVLLALVAVRTVQHRLFGVAPSDIWTIAGAITLVLSCAFVAVYRPARRASRIDPRQALQLE
jgi:predicted permease